MQGWDKLVISVIPYETGRPVAKTPRAVVKNGECHWPDSIIETTRMVFDTRINSYEEKKYRFMVSSVSVYEAHLHATTSSTLSPCFVVS